MANGPQTSYTVNNEDLTKGQPWRLNQILQSINARLSAANAEILTLKAGLAAASVGTGGFANPMTTLGDIIYEDATPAPARLAGNTTIAREFLVSLGTGTDSTPPFYDSLTLGDIPSLSTLYGTLGFPSSYANFFATAATTGLSGNLRHSPTLVLPAGVYVVTLYVVCTVIGIGSVSVSIGWHDAAAAQVLNFAPQALTSVGNRVQGIFVVKTDGTNDLTYSTTATGGTYAIFINVLRLA